MLQAVRLRAELGRWRRAGHRPQLWWRDDDARALTPALERLVAAAERARAPLALAVVPCGCDPGLAAYLKGRGGVSVLQHGWDHRNAGPPGRPCQFAEHESVEAVAGQLDTGARALAAFPGRLPIYVPPWNRLHPNQEAALARAGFVGVSAFGGLSTETGPARADAHLDLMRWKPRARFVGRGRFLARLVHALRERRRQDRWSDPIGLLTHHLDHDEAAWSFLDTLLLMITPHDRVGWLSARAVFGLE